MTISIDTNAPTDSLPPAQIDDEMRNTRWGFHEFLNANHMCTLVGTAIPQTANGAGMHTKVDFYATIATPTPGTDQAVLYTTDDDGDPELAFIADGYTERKLTLNGAINLVQADFATVIEGTKSIFTWDTGEMTLKLDGATIEYDASAGLRIKVPAADDADHSEVGIYLTGKYTGDGNDNRTIAIGTGVKVRHVIIKRDGDQAGTEMIASDADTLSWNQATGSKVTSLETGTNGFKVHDTANTNANTRVYHYFAECVRT